MGRTMPTVLDCPLASAVARCEAEKSSRSAVSMIRSLVDAPTPGMPRNARETVPLLTPASRATSAIVVRRAVVCDLVAITQVWVSASTNQTIRRARASDSPVSWL